MDANYLGNNNLFDVTIVGGGPVGLFTAFYAGMRNMSVHLIESLPKLGGQLTSLYPEKNIYDIAGFPKIKAKELILNLQQQMALFKPVITLNQTLEKIEKTEDGIFKLMTTKEIFYTKTMIITAGNGAFKPRMLNVEREEQFQHKNLHYFVKDVNAFTQKDILLFGGGDSAVDWALTLEKIAKKVTIIHRRNAFRAHEYSVEKLKKSSVDVMTPFKAQTLIGEEQIEHVVIEDIKTGEKKILEVDDVIVNYGVVSELGSIRNWGIDIKKNNILVNSKMETNIDGIYAVGDICTYPGKVKLIATGFGEAPIAVSNAKVHIDPKSRLQSVHSTKLMEKIWV